MLQPDAAYEDITEIPIEHLADEGYNTVILDRDHVLVDADEQTDPAIRDAYDTINDRFETCILTNETLRYGGDAETISERFGTAVVDETAPKPDQEGFEEALQILDADPDETVMIGDSPITDVYGGNKAGLYTIQVEPYGSYDFPLCLSKPIEQGLQRLEAALLEAKNSVS